MGQRRTRAARIAMLGIFFAILLLQAVVPFVGYLPLLPGMPVITLSVMTVMIGAIILGPTEGAFLGLIWGIISLIHAYTAPGTVTFILFANPIIAIVPRVLVGWMAGFLARFFEQHHVSEAVSFGIVGFLGAGLNTLGVVGLSGLFYLHRTSKLLQVLGMQGDSRNLFVILLTVLGVNGLAEALSAILLVPVLAIPLRHVWLKRQ